MRYASRLEWSGWRLAALVAAGGAGAVAVGAWISSRATGPAPSVLAGEENRFHWRGHDIAYRVKGRGAPIVLIHGVYVGASSFEYRRVFDPLATQFRVYAVDLLGFGRSQRPSVAYSPTLYEGLILDFLTQVVGGVDHPVSVIASGLSAAFTIRAAAERPNLFHRLVLIEPTGIEARINAPPLPARRALLRVLRSPLLGEPAYRALTSRPGLRYYLRQVYENPRAIDRKLVGYYHRQARQPGARYPVASFLAGALNTPVRDLYSLLKTPILVVWGKRARTLPPEQARAFRQANPRTEIKTYDTGDLPQEEKASQFASDVAQWLLAPARSRR